MLSGICCVNATGYRWAIRRGIKNDAKWWAL